MNTLKAVIFDVDGTIAETERDGHRAAFNRAFREADIPVQWDAGTYGEFLRVGGGKERIRTQLEILGYASDPCRDDLVMSLHKRKTAIFKEIVDRGDIPLRPGVMRLISEIHAAGIQLAVASTSHASAVHTVLHRLLGEEVMEWFSVILAGDIVSGKKPDPAIYNLASEQLCVRSDECVAVEDSAIGCKAAVSAGMTCVVTTNEYSIGEHFKGSALIVDSLGDPGRVPISVAANPRDIPVGQYVTVGTLKALIQ